MSDYNLKGNVTTIVKFVVMTIAPAIGVNEATQEPLISVIVGVLFLILAYWDAKYDNTLINQSKIIDDDSDVLECLNECEEYKVFEEDSDSHCEGGYDGESVKDLE